MGFSDKQVRALARNVPARAIRSRLRAGHELRYIEGWYALSEANRIFGFDGWDRETVEAKCVMSREARGSLTAIYSARVRITVRTGDTVIVRDGHGTGDAQGASPGEVHDRALKAAETDATKRALATFGKAFGLALYAGRRGITRPAQKDCEQAVATSTATNSGVDVAIGPKGLGPPVTRPARTISENKRPSFGNSDLQSRGLSADTALAPGPGNNAQRPAAVDAAAHNDGPDSESRRAKGAPTGRPIDKSTLAFPEPHRIRDKDHLRFVALQPCLVCTSTPTDAHHVRFAQPRAMSRKVGDDLSVPLCRTHHRELHCCGNEPAFWHDKGIDPIEVARGLWEKTEGRRTCIRAEG